MQDQDESITRNANFEDVALVANNRAILEDIGFNADLYNIANQEIEKLKFRRLTSVVLISVRSVKFFEVSCSLRFCYH